MSHDIPRVLAPHGVSPQDEWHGPYEVVQHPDGGYFVIDNAGRRASVLPLRGFSTVENAERSRDYIDARRASKESAKAIAESLWNGAMQALDPLGTPESRQSQADASSADLLLSLYGPNATVTWHDDERPHVQTIASSPQWFVVDRAGALLHVRHVSDPDTDIAVLAVAPATERIAAGWSAEDARRQADAWVAESGRDYARNIPAIIAWLDAHR